MRNTSILAVKLAATGAAVLILTTSAFAETRHRDETWQGRQEPSSATSTARRDTATTAATSPATTVAGDRLRRNGDAATTNGGYHRQDVITATPATTSPSDNRTWDHRSNGDRPYDRSNTQNTRSYDRSNTQQDNRSYDRSRTQQDNHSYDRSRTQQDNRSYDRSRTQQENRSYDRSQQRSHEYRNGELRSDGRISTQGHIRSYSHERGGYRVYLDRGNYSYWVPESYFVGHRLAVGLDIRLGGIFRNGGIYVDLFGWPGDRYYNDPYYNDPYYNGSYGYGMQSGYLRGVVDRIDFRTGSVWLIDENSRQLVSVDLRSVDRRYSRLDVRDLQRGDRVTLAGDWVRGDIFDAVRIESIDAY